MSESPPLPPLHRALLSLDELAALCADILGCAELIDVQLRTQRHAMQQATPGYGPDALHKAHELLAQREVLGAQLRYRFEGLEWWDTLMWTPQGLSLVRIAHDWAAYKAQASAAQDQGSGQDS
jgi:hypothetical protein